MHKNIKEQKCQDRVNSKKRRDKITSFINKKGATQNRLPLFSEGNLSYFSIKYIVLKSKPMPKSISLLSWSLIALTFTKLS